MTEPTPKKVSARKKATVRKQAAAHKRTSVPKPTAAARKTTVRGNPTARKTLAGKKRSSAHKRPRGQTTPTKAVAKPVASVATPSRADGADERRTRVNPRIRERKVAVARDAGRHRLFILTSVLAIPALGATAFLLLHTSLFAINTIHLSGEVNTSPESIMSISGLATHPPLIDVNPPAVEAKIESLPWVESAVVSRDWLKGVSVRIVEYAPVAEVAVNKNSFELFADSGRALGYSSTSIAGLPNIKAVTDLPLPGQRANATLTGEIAVAGAVPVSIVADIQQITSTKKDGIVALLPDTVTAIFGTTSSLHDKMTALTTLIKDHVSLVGVASIDLRVPSSPVLSS